MIATIKRVAVIAALTTTSLTLAQETPPDVTTLLAANELEHAREALLDAVDKEPDRPDLLFELGLLELRLENPDAAAFHFASAASSFGQRFDLVYNQAISLAEAGDFAAASQLLQEAIEAGRTPNHLHTRVLDVLGDAQYEAEAYELAAQTFTQLHEITGEPRSAYKALLARYQLGERAELVVPLKRLRDTVGHDVSKLLADIYMDTNLITYGERELKDARERAVNEVNFEALTELTSELARHYYNLERFNEAIHLLEQLPDPPSNYAHYLLGLTYLAADQPEKAQEIFAKPRDGQEQLYTLLRIIADHEAGNHQDAADRIEVVASYYAGALSQIAHIDVGAAALLASAQANIEIGKEERANSIANEIPTAALTPEQRVQLGDIHYLAGDYQAAQLAYSAAMDEPGVNPDTYLAAARNLADALLADKQFEQAKLAYQRVLGLASYDTEAYYYYAWTLLAMTERDNAQEAFQTAAARGFAPAREALNTHF